MDFTPCQLRSLSYFQPYPAAFHIALEWGELLALLDLKTELPEALYPHLNSSHKAAR